MKTGCTHMNISRRTLQLEQDAQTASLISACRDRIESRPRVPSPGLTPSSFITAISKSLHRRPLSSVANSAQGASPEHLAFPLHPWDLFRNSPRPRKKINKGVNPNKTTFAEPFPTGQCRERPGTWPVRLAPSKDGSHRRSRSLRKSAGCPANQDHSRGARHARRALTHCRCRAANQAAGLFPANHCRVSPAYQRVLVQLTEERNLSSAN